MWYAVIDPASGQLLSTGTVLADPLPKGVDAIELGDELPAGEWNSKSRQFDPPVAIKAVLEPIDLLRRFTFAEEVAIRTAAKADVGIEVFLARLAAAKTVKLDHPDTLAGLQYLKSKGLIEPARAAEILA